MIELRELTIADADVYYAVLDRSRAHLNQRGDYQAEAAATPEWVRSYFEDPPDANIRFGIFLGRELVGRDLNPVNPPHYAIGYWLVADHTGQGHATEACRQAIEHACTLGATEIYADVTHGNDKSIAVLDRLGFEQVADFETYTRFRLKVPDTPG